MANLFDNYGFAIEVVQSQGEEDLLSLQAEQIENLKMWIVAFLIVAFVIIVIMSFIIQSNRLLKKQNEKIKSQQEEISRINSNLAIQVENLREMNSEKNSVINYVSHDLITPLGNIEGLVNLVLLKKDGLSDENIDYLNKILEVVKDGRETIHSMLNINKIDQEVRGIELLEHDAVSLIDEVLLGHEFLTQEREITVTKKHNHESLTFKTDKQYFKQLFGNILSYALKSTPPGKEVSIESNVVNETIQIRITDQGKGLSEKDKERLFLKYTQNRGGFDQQGISLAIAKQLIDKLNAKVRVDSTPEEGTKFTLEFLSTT